MAAEPYHLSDQATTAAAAAAAAPPGELHTPRTCTHRALCAPFGLHMGSGILDILLEFLQVSELSRGLYHGARNGRHSLCADFRRPYWVSWIADF